MNRLRQVRKQKGLTLEELADTYGEDEDVLVNAEINVF